MSQWLPLYSPVILDCLARVASEQSDSPPPPPPQQKPTQPDEWKNKEVHIKHLSDYIKQGSSDFFLLLVITVIIPWEDPARYPPPPPPPPCRLDAHFYAWLHTYFLSSWRLFFQKVAKILNFWKVALNFCDTVNPLSVSSRQFFTQQIRDNVSLWSRRHCIKWQCSLFDRLCQFHQRLHLKNT